MALSACLRIAWWVYLSPSVLPGYYWTINSTVALCGSAKYYCPGTFLDNHRCVLYVEELQLLHETFVPCRFRCSWFARAAVVLPLVRYVVTPAFYSAPESIAPDRRYYQLPCEDNRYCVDGVASLCGRTYCWPTPLAATAREGRAGELAALGFALQPGLSLGDVIEIQFDEETNTPTLPTTADVMRLLVFSAPFDEDGLTFLVEWTDPSLLKLTIITTSGTDPLLTQIGVLNFYVSAAGNLRCVAGSGAPYGGRGVKVTVCERYVSRLRARVFCMQTYQRHVVSVPLPK